MRKLVNIVVVVLIYFVSLAASYRLLTGASASIAPDIAKWLWSVGALLIATLAQLSWKIHETKRVEGLASNQRMKLRRISGLIGLRIYLLGLLVFLSSVVGFASAYVRHEVAAAYMTQISLGIMLGSAIICVFLVPLMQRDIQRFEDGARELASRQKDQSAFTDRLSKAGAGD